MFVCLLILLCPWPRSFTDLQEERQGKDGQQDGVPFGWLLAVHATCDLVTVERLAPESHLWGAGVRGRWQAVGCRSERQRSYPSNCPLSPASQAVFNKLGLNHSLALSEGWPPLIRWARPPSILSFSVSSLLFTYYLICCVLGGWVVVPGRHSSPQAWQEHFYSLSYLSGPQGPALPLPSLSL